MTNLRKYGLIILLLIPPAIYLYFILSRAVNFPFADEFERILQFLIDFENKKPLFGLLFEQRNGHINFTTKSIALVLYKTNGTFNFQHLIFIGNVAYMSTVGFIGFYLKKNNYNYTALLILSLFAFQLVFWGSALWGLVICQHAFVLLTSCLSLYFMTKEKIGFSILFAILASLTFGNGMLVWPIGMLLLFDKRKYMVLSLWFALTIIVFSMYFYISSETSMYLYNPLRLTIYIANVCSGFVFHHNNAFSKIFGLGVFGFVSYVIYNYRKDQFLRAMLLFFLGSIMLIGLHRSQLDMTSAFSSRYQLYPVFMFGLALILFFKDKEIVLSYAGISLGVLLYASALPWTMKKIKGRNYILTVQQREVLTKPLNNCKLFKEHNMENELYYNITHEAIEKGIYNHVIITDE